jgi:citrate lyase beta subunit
VRAAGTACDAVVIDLEDGVTAQAKPAARAAAIEVLAAVDFGRRESGVRINAPGTLEFEHDVEALADIAMDVVWIAKVETPGQVEQCARCLPRTAALVASIETPRGLFAATEIAAAAAAVSPRSALFFGSGDYCMETGARPGPAGLGFPRGLIVAAAAMHDLQAIDAAYFLDPKDPVATGEDARLAVELGFDGKLVFHPVQIDAVNRAFAPPADQIARARRLVTAFEEARARGEGTLVVDGVFLAVDTVRPLERVLWMAGQLGLDDSTSTR